jgi:hypothetical protein
MALFSGALEWLGQEHRVDPAVLTSRVLIMLKDGDNTVGRTSLSVADAKCVSARLPVLFSRKAAICILAVSQAFKEPSLGAF